MSIAKAFAAAGFILAFAAGFLVRGAVRLEPVAHAQASTHVFELRTYYAAPGKFDALNARFRDNTIRIFGKHGIPNVGYYTPVDGAPGAGQQLVYILPHASREAATKFWADFQADPEWVKVKAASEANGPLTTKVDSVFLKATDYSAVK